MKHAIRQDNVMIEKIYYVFQIDVFVAKLEMAMVIFKYMQLVIIHVLLVYPVGTQVIEFVTSLVVKIQTCQLIFAILHINGVHNGSTHIGTASVGVVLL